MEEDQNDEIQFLVVIVLLEQNTVAILGLILYNDEDEIKRLRITYDILSASKRFREFKPCLKRYLTSHIQSKILAIQPDEWDVATFLPMHQFKKARPQEVWQDSVNEIKQY
mgnify:CR=1 FL=1